MLSPGCYLAKVDLASAYRSVKIHPTSLKATGLKWTFHGHSQPTYFRDTRLSFGSCKSPYIFHTLTSKVRHMMAKRGFHNLCVYLDDFLIIESTLEKCQLALSTLIKLLRSLSFNINWSKVEGPSQNLVFLGVNIDTLSLTLSLPQNRVDELMKLLTEFSHRTRASKRQLQSLAGKLNWGRIFLRRIDRFLSIIYPSVLPWDHVTVFPEFKMRWRLP